MKAKTFVIGFVAVVVLAAAASVYMNLTATRPGKTVTSAASPDGRYLIAGVPAGTWVGTVSTSDGARWQSTAVTTGGPTVEVQLE